MLLNHARTTSSIVSAHIQLSSYAGAYKGKDEMQRHKAEACKAAFAYSILFTAQLKSTHFLVALVGTVIYVDLNRGSLPPSY